MTTHINRESLLGEFPFHHVTPIELIDLLETPQNRIENNFQGYLYQSSTK